MARWWARLNLCKFMMVDDECLCKLIGTKNVTTTGHYPQIDEQVGIFNKAVVDMLQKKLIGEEQWVELHILITF